MVTSGKLVLQIWLSCTLLPIHGHGTGFNVQNHSPPHTHTTDNQDNQHFNLLNTDHSFVLETYKLLCSGSLLNCIPYCATDHLNLFLLCIFVSTSQPLTLFLLYPYTCYLLLFYSFKNKFF